MTLRRFSILVLALLQPSIALSAKPAAFAIIVGNNSPPKSEEGNALRVLRYADDDAARYHQFFSSFAQKTWLLTVLDRETQVRHAGLAAIAKPPTWTSVEESIRQAATLIALARRGGSRTVFYFVFSGHGARGVNGEGYLSLEDGALTRQRLYEQVLDRIPSDVVHIIVDACYADAVIGTRRIFGNEADATAATVTSEEVGQLLEQTTLRRFKHVGAIIATTANHEAHEWSRIESGIFTHEVLSGLYGGADVNADGQIEYSELQAFVAAAGRNIHDTRARPHVISLPPQRNLAEPIVERGWFGQRRKLVGNFSKLGHFFVELQNGQRFVDGHLSNPFESELLLPATGSIFVRTNELEAEIGSMSQGSIKLASLGFQQRQVQERGSVEAAYRTALFEAPFTPTYYQGFVDSTGAVAVRFRDTEGGRPPARSSGKTRKYLAWGSAGLAAASAATAIITGALSLKARSDFGSTTMQREAQEANQRYVNYGTASIISMGVAAGSGLLAWWLWPKKARTAPVLSSSFRSKDNFFLDASLSW